MASHMISGTEGYAEQTDALVADYERIRFADLHRPILHLIPTAPSTVLDIGAGTGRDAAALAELGHRVVAVEPTATLRQWAAAQHPSPQIAWLNDSLPDLARVDASDQRFDLIMLTAVWMHLDPAQRERAMPVLARLAAAGGIITMTLRHGPVPAGRRMFEVTGDETMRLASDAGLRLTLRLDNQPSQFTRTDVTWTRLAFAKEPA